MNTQGFIAYLAVSGICLLLNNAVLIVADLRGCTLLTAVLLSYLFVVVIGYVLHSAITFRQPFGYFAFGRYAIAMAGNVPLLWATTWFWHSIAELPISSAAPLATACMALINFALGRWAISGCREVART